MIDQKDCTIIIPHLGATKEQCYSLHQCITSLQEFSSEIKRVIIKNGNTGCFCHRDIRIVDQGQCKATNAGIAITNTPWILVSNDDMVYGKNWWINLTDIGDEEFDCISPQLIEPRPGAPTFQVFFAGGAGGDFDKQKLLDYLPTREVQGLRTGFNLPFLIKRELWDFIGGYDINYDPWGSNSDSDLEYKIKLAGVQPYQNTNCGVYHFSQTSGTFDPKNGAYYQKNFQIFKDKWGFDRTDDGIWEATFEIPGIPTRKFLPEWEGKYGRK